MPADNQVLLEATAAVDDARRNIDAFVFGVQGAAAKLSQHEEIVVDVARAKRNVDLLGEELRQFKDSAAIPTAVQVRVEKAVAEVQRVIAAARQVRPVLEDTSKGDPLAPLLGQFAAAGKAVGDFTSRTTAGSKQFGQGFEAAATRARISLEGLAREIGAAQQRGAPVSPQHIALLDKLEHEYRQAVTAARQFRAAQEQVRGEMKAVQAEMAVAVPTSNLLADSIARVGFAVKAFIVGALIRELRELGKEAFTASETIKGIRRSLEASLGSSEAAADAYEFVRKEVERLGLELAPTATEFARLAAAARGTILEGQGIRDVFTAIAERATVMRLSTEEVNGLIKALTDSLSKGTLQMEELKQQLGDRLPGAMDIFARALGIPKDELIDLASKGAIPAAEAIAAFGQQLRNETGWEAVKEGATSATSEVNRFTNALFEAKGELGDGFAPAAGDAAVSLRDMVRDGKPVLEFLGRLAGALVRGTTVMADLKRALDEQLSGSVASAGAEILALAKIIESGLLGSFEKLARLAGFGEFAAQVGQARAELSAAFDVMEARLSGIAARQTLAAIGLEMNALGGAARSAAPGVAKAGDETNILGTAAQKTAEKISKAVIEIFRYAEALPKAGTVQREEADKIVKAIDKQLRAIRELPAAEEAAFKDRAARLEELRERFFQFTAAYEKEQDKQAKAAQKTADKEQKILDQRTKNLEAFLRRVKELGDEAVGAQGGNADDLRRRLAEAQSELGSIESPADPRLSPEDLARADALRQQIGDLENDLERLGRQGAAAGTQASQGAQQVAEVSRQAAESLKETILEALTSSEEFAAAFQQLGPVAQQQLELLVKGFLSSVDAQQLSKAELQSFIETLSGMLEQAGAVGEGFADRLKLLTGATTDVSVAFDQLRQSGQGQAEQIAALGPAGEQAAAGLREVAAAAPEASAAAEQGGGGYIRAHDEAVRLGEANTKLAATFVEVRSQVGPASDGIITFGDKTAQVGAAGDEASGGVIKFGDKVFELGDKAKEGGSGLEKVATAADKAGASSERAASGVERAGSAAQGARSHLVNLGDAVSKAGSASQESAPAVDRLATAEQKAIEPSAALAKSLGEIAKLKLGDDLSKAAEALVKITESASRAVENLGKLAVFATEQVPKIIKLAEAIRRMDEALGKVNGRLATQNPLLEANVELCRALAECQGTQT